MTTIVEKRKAQVLMRESSLKFYSLGIVAVNKSRNSPYIMAVPIEELPMTTGTTEDVNVKAKGAAKPNVFHKVAKRPSTLDKQKTTYSVEVPDHKKVSRAYNVVAESMIVAKWRPIGDNNRVTAPDVIAGETVLLMRVADTDDYTWETIGYEPGIRRQETVCFMFGNIPSGQAAIDKETSYWLEVSTHDKYVHLHTSKNDGEPYSYDIRLDTEKGTFEITDNSGNNIVLNSSQNQITLLNAAGSTCDMLGPDVSVKATRKLKLSGDSVEISGSSSVTVSSPNTTVD